MDQESKDSPAKSSAELKRSSCLLGKFKQRLEPVVEASNEFSLEATDRLQKSMRSSHRPPSPFIVEKFDYSLMIDEDSPRKPETSTNDQLSTSARIKKLPSYREHQVGESTIDFNPLEFQSEARMNSPLFKTPAKTPKTESPSAPSKAGFFSLRKKTNKLEKSDNGEGNIVPTLHFPFPIHPIGGKIKIVNNIFQNSILQNVVKPSDADQKRKLSKRLDSKSAARRKSNISMDFRDQQLQAQPIQKPKRILNQLLSPQHKTDKDKHFSFHGMTSNYSSMQKTKKESGEDGQNQCKSRILDESSNTIVVNKKLQLGNIIEGSSKRGSQTELSPAQIEEMRKFHAKLNKLIKDLNCTDYLSEGEELNLKLQWRFVKDMASKYAEVSQKYKLF